MEKHVAGAIYGFIIGDAIGYPYNDRRISGKITMRPSENFPAGTYTDASAMMLTGIASINEWNQINYPDLMDKLRDWYLAGFLGTSAKSVDDEEFSEAKANVVQAVKNFDTGMPVDKCAMIDELSFNNAALLRMLPIAIYVANEPLDKIILTTHLATRTTNHIPHAEVVSTIYSLIIANMITGQGEKVFNAVNEFYTSNGLSAHHDALAEFQAWKQSNEPKGTDHVFDSFWSAWAAYSAHQGDFQQAVEMAITTGGCCNETAAIAGSLVGLSEGIDAIPQEYVQVIKIGSPAVHEVTNFVRRFKAIEATS